MKQTILTIIFILISSVLTLEISSFTNLSLTMTMPGFLFGLSLTIPNILSDFKKYMREIKMILLYPILWIISIALYFILQMITPTLADKTPYIIVGLISGIGTTLAYDWQFGLKNRKVGLVTVTLLSIVAVLIFDHFFPIPHDKELNIGKQVAIWEILVGLGILTNRKVKPNIKLNENSFNKNSFNENKNAL